MNNGLILFIILWFAVGFISMVSLWIIFMRGVEFDENFFDKECVHMSFASLLLGLISPIVIFLAFAYEEKSFTRFIYKVANIGVKKEEISKEED